MRILADRREPAQVPPSTPFIPPCPRPGCSRRVLVVEKGTRGQTFYAHPDGIWHVTGIREEAA